MAKKTLLDNIIESIKGIDGQLIKQSGTTKQMISDLNYKVVEPAKSAADSAQSAADSAVAYANDAIEKSRVNSQAIDDINSAVSDAASDAAVARSDGLRAWNAAQSNVNLIDLNYASASAAISSARTEAIAAADEAKTSASAAQADIVAVRSDVATVQADVTATRSDVAVAKSDIADTKTTLAQTASDLNSKISGVETSLADTTSALSDAKTEFNSDVAEAKNLANAAQTTADSAIKSASSVANDLTAVASQAKANADGITKVTSDVGLLQTTVADNSGNISTIQETAKQIQQAVSDNAGNITVAKQTADSAVAVASDAKSNATVAIQTASQASITASNASGQTASAVLTANGALTTASNAKSDATVAIQTASGASLTAVNAQSDATVAKQTASEAKVQASNAESDFAQISIRAGKIEASVANNSGAIASMQQTANGLTTTVGEVNDRINKIVDNTNWTTKTGVLDMNTLTTTQNIYYRDSSLKNADGETGWAYIQVISMGERVTQTVWHDRSSIQHTRTGAVSGSSYNWDVWNKVATYAQVVEVKNTVDGITTIINDPKTGLNATYQTAAGNATTISDIKGDVSQLKVSASSASVALSDAAGNISSLQATASDLETKYADAAGDISQIKTDAKGMTQTISDAQGDIAKLKTRADGFDTQFSSINGSINKIQTDASGTTQTLTNAKSDIAVLQSRADGFDTKYADMAGDINTLKADVSGFSQTLVSAKGDISTLKATATGLKNTLTDAQGNISTLQSDVSGLKKTTSDNTGNIATLQANANTLTSQMSSAQGDISTLKQTASGISSQVTALSDKAMQNRGTVDSPDFNSLTQAGYYTITSPSNGKNYPIGSWGTLEVSGQVTDNNGRLNQKYVADNNGPIYTRQYNNLTKSWTAWFKVANQNDIDTLNGKITANTTAIEQNKNAITLKADQTDVDTVKGTVAGLQSSLTVQGNQIQTKVSASDVSGMLKGYATQDYTQSLVTQQANTLSSTITTVKNQVNSLESAIDWTTKTGALDMDTLTTTQNIYYRDTNLKNADGEAGWAYIQVVSMGERVTQTVWHDRSSIQHTRTGAIDGSTYDWDAWNRTATNAQISNLTQSLDGLRSTVVTKADQSTVTELSNLVQTKVSSGDFTSTTTQLKNLINQRVQVGDVISQINQEAGGNTLIQVANGKGKLALNASSVVFTGDAFIPDAYISTINADKLMFYGSDGTSATMGASVAQYDDDKTKSTINLQYSGGIEIHSSDQQGSILTMHDNTIRLASKSWGDNPNAYQYSGFYAAPNYSLMNTYHRDGTTSGVAIDDNQIHIYGSSKDQQLGALKADVGWYSINGKTGSLTGDQISLKAGNTQAMLKDNYIDIENTNDTNSKNYDVAIHIKGWAEMTGWFTCMGLTQTSLLSTKTRIEPLDTAKALELINSADVATYQYKQEVAHGGTKRHASVIIDDVNDVARYQTPDEIISEDRQGRNDGDIVGYLMGAVQELTKKLKTLESKVG